MILDKVIYKRYIFGCPVWVPKKTNKIETNIIFIMGVSGVGKSTIGKLLSKKLTIPFFDGDDFHPEENILKMSEGNALSDNDRLGWLQTLNKLAVEQLQKSGCIIVCSALKESYRDILNTDIQDKVKWVFLEGSFELIQKRINERKDHFMSADLLKSQFDILEKPKDVINIEISLAPNEIVEEINKQLIQ